MNKANPHYSLEHDLEEAETAARNLPDQIEKLRQRVRQAKADLILGQVREGAPGKH